MDRPCGGVQEEVVRMEPLPFPAGPCPCAPLEDEDHLEEILLRLPPQPSSLPRASLVCKRWRSILSDPKFIKRFRKHHKEPPLLGFFVGDYGTVFTPVLDPPDRIPPMRFNLPWSRSSNQQWVFLGCRHGLTILINGHQRVVVLWDPLTDQQHHLLFPTMLVLEQMCTYHGALLMCADAEDLQLLGDCFSSSPFKFVLICSGYTRASACIYESSSGVWGSIVSTTTNDRVLRRKSSIVIDNAVYWLFCEGDILVLDIERQTLCVIEKPTNVHPTNCGCFQLLRIDDDNGLGLAVMSKLTIQLWKRKSNCDNVVEWIQLQKIIQLEGLFPQGMDRYFKKAYMEGYDEYSNVIVLATYIGDFMLHLESMRITRFSKIRNSWNIMIHHPYRNFYTAGRGVGWKSVVQKH